MVTKVSYATNAFNYVSTDSIISIISAILKMFFWLEIIAKKIIANFTVEQDSNSFLLFQEKNRYYIT
jgi:hypothetical protein